MHKIDTNNRREPLFNKNVNTSAISNIYTQSPQNNSNLAVAQNSVVPSIEIPNKNQTVGNLAIKEDNFIQPAQKQKYNPTFDFMNDDSIANQNSKKNKKISPEDIYQTETQRKQTKNKTETSQQEELLSVDVSKQYNKNTPSSQQPSSNSFSEKDKNLYNLPDINLLSDHREAQNLVYDEETLKTNAAKLEEVLNDFGIKGQIVKVRPGPVVTLYELEPAPGTKAARVIGLSDDIARCMSVSSVRMAVVSGHNTIGIELPNEKRETVWLRELLEDKEFKNSKNILNVTLGKDIGGQHIYADLSKMPHLLVAGTTGSGKSVGVNSMIISLLYRMTPDECKLIMIDPKQLEFSMYNGIPHLLTPVITDPGKAVVGLKWAVREMEDRYRAMALLNVRNIAMHTAGQILVGKHNFASFMAAGSKITDPTRTITRLTVSRLDENTVGLRVSADGFLYNMVRIITGTLWEFGKNMTPVPEMERILAGQNRNLAGKTAPACGLYLESVEYPAEYGVQWKCE